jgi:hypothetical protein
MTDLAQQIKALADYHYIDLFRVIRAAGRSDRAKAQAASVYLATALSEAERMREALERIADEHTERDWIECQTIARAAIGGE